MSQTDTHRKQLKSIQLLIGGFQAWFLHRWVSKISYVFSSNFYFFIWIWLVLALPKSIVRKQIRNLIFFTPSLLLATLSLCKAMQMAMMLYTHTRRHCSAHADSWSLIFATWHFVFLLLVSRCDLGCCLIPCLIDDLKDVTHTCPYCKGYIYTYKRIC